MKPTRIPILGATLLVAGVAGWGLLTGAYGSIAELPTGPIITVFVVALLVAFLAWSTRNRLQGLRGAKPPEPLTVARYAVLARACSPVGAALAGLWLGFLVYLLRQDGMVMAVRHDRVTAIVGAASGVALVAAALWLEWVCRIRVDHDDDQKGARA